ncbi:MAG: hypothetical protein KAK01_04090, partial [Candidatus Marinimicrobia bacterium]|nr:hypothetical protein [Candidatus Neomarinimicrobiota bacterium]
MIKLLSLRFPILLFLFLLTNGTMLSQPNVKLSTTFVTPRVGMLEYEESTYWNTVVNYSQQFGTR